MASMTPNSRPTSPTVRYPGLHPNIVQEIKSIDPNEPRNVLEWMFSPAFRSEVPIPDSRRPSVVTRAFRHELKQLHDSLPTWVKQDTPWLIRFSHGNGKDWAPWGSLKGMPGEILWDEMDDQTIRNVAVWLYGVKDLYEGQSFADVKDRWPSKRDSGVGLGLGELSRVAASAPRLPERVIEEVAQVKKEESK